MDLPPPPLIHRQRIAFSQTDAAGLAHFSTYFVLMEAAEANLFRCLGLPLIQTDSEPIAGFPRVDVQCRFRRPVAFDELVETRLFLENIEPSRLHYRFAFLNEAGQRCASGSMVTAYARRTQGGDLQSTPIPEPVRNALQSWQFTSASGR